MLPNCRGIRAVRGQNLVPTVDVVLLNQLLLVLKKILCIRDPLFEGLIGEPGQEVLL